MHNEFPHLKNTKNAPSISEFKHLYDTNKKFGNLIDEASKEMKRSGGKWKTAFGYISIAGVGTGLLGVLGAIELVRHNMRGCTRVETLHEKIISCKVLQTGCNISADGIGSFPICDKIQVPREIAEGECDNNKQYCIRCDSEIKDEKDPNFIGHVEDIPENVIFKCIHHVDWGDGAANFLGVLGDKLDDVGGSLGNIWNIIKWFVYGGVVMILTFVVFLIYKSIRSVSNVVTGKEK